jgi:hypothetical protein
MPPRPISVLASLAILGATSSLAARQPVPSARLVRVEGRVTLDGQLRAEPFGSCASNAPKPAR